MRLFLTSLMLLAVVAVVAIPGSARALSCAIPCNAELCMASEPLLEGTVVGLDAESVTFRIDRIHGVDGGSVLVGDTITTYRPCCFPDFDGALLSRHWEDFYHVLPTQSGELLCVYPGQRLPVATAIDLVLSDDCDAAAEKVMEPVPPCEGGGSIFDCTSGPGTADLLTIAFAGGLFAMVRRRQRATIVQGTDL